MVSQLSSFLPPYHRPFDTLYFHNWRYLQPARPKYGETADLPSNRTLKEPPLERRYELTHQGAGDPWKNALLCYAESDDDLTWRYPDVGNGELKIGNYDNVVFGEPWVPGETNSITW